jgi:hypothetical protein
MYRLAESRRGSVKKKKLYRGASRAGKEEKVEGKRRCVGMYFLFLL